MPMYPARMSSLGDQIRVPRDFDFIPGLPLGATLTRNTGGYAAGADGLPVAFSASQPRRAYVYADGLWMPGGIMIEDLATNLSTFSASTSQGSWSANGVGGVAVVNGQAGPFGNDAALVTGNGASTTHLHTAPAVSTTAAVQYCGSRFVKPLGGLARLQLSGGSLFGFAYANFNFAGEGALVGQSALTLAAGIERWGGGWWRIWLAAAASATGATSGPSVALITADGDPRNPTNTSSGSYLTTQSQVEAGLKPSSPIVTGAATATRAADVVTLNWASRGAHDGVQGIRYGFGNGSTQDAPAAIVGGSAPVPAGLNRSILKSARLAA